MDAPISLAERNRINAENRAKYEATQQQAAADKLARKAVNRAAQLDRQARMLESSCGSVEQTGNPRRGCDCAACVRRRNAKNGQQRKRRKPVLDNDLEQIESGAHEEYRVERFAKYGLTEEAYFKMLKEQGGGCAICGTKTPGGRGKGSATFHVDHDHACCPGGGSCGECVRGLLCADCNIGLGKFKDSIESLRAAIKYLED